MVAKKIARSPAKKKAARPSQRPASGDSTAEFEALLRASPRKKRYELRLYVTGTSPRSGQAIANVRALCEEFLPGRYDLEVIDIFQQPGRAVTEQIIAAPTLIKITPKPARRLIGDLSDRHKVLAGLNLAGRAVGAA